MEVVGQGKVVRPKGAGEGTYVLKDKAPFPPICAHVDEVRCMAGQETGHR